MISTRPKRGETSPLLLKKIEKGWLSLCNFPQLFFLFSFFLLLVLQILRHIFISCSGILLLQFASLCCCSSCFCFRILLPTVLDVPGSLLNRKPLALTGVYTRAWTLVGLAAFIMRALVQSAPLATYNKQMNQNKQTGK